EDALARMRKRYPELTQNLPSNPLPPSEEITPVRGEYVDAIDKSLRPYPPGVDNVTYGKHTAHRILQVAKVIELVFLVAVIVLLIASTVLIANTIRLSIFS